MEKDLSDHNQIVSLIVPCYNAGPYLKEFLTSLLSQTYDKVELIFVNDGSTDGSEAVFREFEPEFKKKWSVKYLSQENKGQAAAVNAGLQQASGEFLMWSDADDVMLPDSIREKAEFLIAHPAYDMVRNDFYFAKPAGDDGKHDDGEAGKPDKGENVKANDGEAGKQYGEDGTQESLAIGYGSDALKKEDIFRGIFDSTVPCLAGTYMMRMRLFDACYPDRTMPLSPEGQNLQLLLPPASRSLCAFIDKPLMKYRIHRGSHSNRQRDLRQMFAREEGFRELRKQLLPYCDCDREAYAALADTIFEKQKKKIAAGLVRQMKTEMQAGNTKQKSIGKKHMGEIQESNIREEA